jgi:hypothetical protein
VTDSRAFDSNTDLAMDVTDAGISREEIELPAKAHSSIVVTVLAMTNEVIALLRKAYPSIRVIV